VDEYNGIVEQLVSLLEGEDSRLLGDMEADMAALAEKLQFEKAAVYRSYIQSLEALLRKEEVRDFTEGNHQFLIAENLDADRVKFFLIRRTDVLFSGIYDVSAGNTVGQIKSQILNELEGAGAAEKKEVSRFEMDKAQIIYSYLKSGKCRYTAVSEKKLVHGLDHVIGGLLE
jgi:excinuclease ABC subunit C